MAHTRKIGQSPDFCVAALEDAMTRYGKPDIFNTACYKPFVKLSLAA